MGACLSRGQGVGATAPKPDEGVAAAPKVTAAVVSGGGKAAPATSSSLHVVDANRNNPVAVGSPPPAPAATATEFQPASVDVPASNSVTPAAGPFSSGVAQDGLSSGNGPEHLLVDGESAAVQVPHSKQNGVSPTPESCVSISPFASMSSEPITSSESLKDGGPSENGVGVPTLGWHTFPQTELLPGQTYRGPPNLDANAERKRLHALKRLGIDFTSQEASLDFITKLVTNVCSVTSSMIVLIDSQSCYMKSGSGGGVPQDQRTVKRDLSICTWVLAPLNPTVMVVEDLSADPRFADHPFVAGPPHVRFMAAAPLMDASGQRVGCLTVHDFQPRKFDAEQCNVLCNFAEMTMREINRISESGVQRAMSLNPTPENEQLLRSIDACSDGVVLLDVRIARWPVLFSNEGWSQLTGQQPVSGSLKCFWDAFRLPGTSTSKNPWQMYEEHVERGDVFRLDIIPAGSSGKQLFPVTFKPATEALDEGMVNINVPGQAASANPSTPSQKSFYFGTISQKSRSSSGSGGKTEGDANSPGQLSKQNSVTRSEEEVKPPIPGVRLGPLLGKGSFGSVHYGTWNGAQIAVKVIQHMATEAEKQARDEQLEAILGLKMMHPNIVRTFQFATKDRSSTPASLSERLRMDMNMNGSIPEEGPNTPTGQRRMMETWIVLELCNRGSLQDAIDKGAFRTQGTAQEGSPNMINIMRTATEIAGAMTYLHSLDILHSDLNGNNILLISNTGIDDRPFSIKVSDFGLSRIHIGEKTVATQTYGTVTHMPPELLSEGRLSKAADVYAFGVLLWEMLTGARPWAGLRHVQIITHKMRNGSQLKWPSDVYPAYKDLAQRCMNPDPHMRPAFLEALETLEQIRDLAERGLLARSPSYIGPSRSAMGALLGAVPNIDEGEEDGKGGTPS